MELDKREGNRLMETKQVGNNTNRWTIWGCYRKAIRATVVLFPLLGITNLLFAVNPGGKGDLENAYMLTNAILQSSQARPFLTVFPWVQPAWLLCFTLDQ